MKKFRPSLITAALIGGGLCSLHTPLYAQEALDEQSQDEQVIEKIEVRGFSTSLIQSLNQKRFGDTVSEQISADDLGGLPDVSMADALTRLPGISAVRTGGQAAEINIRGMAGDFVFSTLNGREQVSTSGSRSIEFDQYPSELISSAAVYKTPKASLIEGGVAGTVELKTASPLAIDEPYKLNVNLRGMYNDRAGEIADGEEYGHRMSFSYQGKFLDDTLGLAFGYARLYQPSVSTQFVGLAYNAERDLDGDGENEYLSEGFELQHQGGEETRDGYMAAIEWVAADNFTLRADAFLSKFDSEEFARGFRVKFDGTRSSVNNAVINGSSVTGASIGRTSSSSTRVELVNDDNRDYDEVASFGINADWQVTDDFSLAFDISLSNAKSNFRNGLLWALVAEDANADTPTLDTNVAINYQLNGLNLPDVGFNQAADFTDLDKVMVSKYGIYPYENEDKITAYRIDAQYQLDMPIFSSIEVGMRYSEREYSNDRSVFEYGNDSGFSSSEAPLQLTEDMVNVVDWEGEFSYFPSYLAIDVNKALDAWFPDGRPQPVQSWGSGFEGVINSTTTGGRDTSWSMLESGDVYEDVFAAYFMANIDTELFGLPITGNIGIRMVETDQRSTVLQDVDGDPEQGAQYITDEVGLISDQYRPAIIGVKYTDYLPSLNLNFKLTEHDQIRFAAAKVMGRAPINRLFSNASVYVEDVAAVMDEDTGEIVLSSQTAKITGNSTNSPYLLPFYATQFDLSYERYFEDTDGAFVAAIFYKNIDSFIDTFGIDPFDFAGNGFDVPTSVTVNVYDSDGDLVYDTDGEVLTVEVPTENSTYTTAVNNAEGGYIRGLELAYTQIYSFLPEPFNGLGVSASYSYTESEIQKSTDLGGASVEQSLNGLSENVLNTTVFWEYQDFETRVSVRYRSPFVSDQVAINSQEVNFDKETVVDFQASYNVDEHLGFLFQVNNLTDEPTKSYFGTEALTGTIQYFGTQYFLGMTYSL